MAICIAWVVVLLLVTAMQAQVGVEARAISGEERKALLALYEATGGSGWVHRDGWLGPVGSECRWYGVVCGTAVTGDLTGKLTVTDLDVPQNGLKGSLPPEVDALRGLKRLILTGNLVTAPLPDALLQRFDEAQLEIEPLSLVHDVEEVLFDRNNPALLCLGSRAKLQANRTVHLERKLCRERHGRQTREVYCEHREGKTLEFDRLARFLVHSGFFAEGESRVSNRWLDVTEITVIAKRAGRPPIRRSWSAPKSISNWSLELLLEGIIARVEWAAPVTRISCPSESRN